MITLLEAISDCHEWNNKQKAFVTVSTSYNTAANFLCKAIKKLDTKNDMVLVSKEINLDHWELNKHSGFIW